MNKALVLGAGGFIGHHLVNKLKQQGTWVRGVDLKKPLYQATLADEFIITDLRIQENCKEIFDQYFDEVYQLAADMGGAGYLFTGENDAKVMTNSALINLNVVSFCQKCGINNVFYSSSACIYPEYNQMDPSKPVCVESSAYPAAPDSEYGWEKLFSERLYMAYNRNYEMNNNIARYHNIFGPFGSWNNGKEKSPAALCRKIAEAPDGGTIEIWGDGEQTRSYLFVDECVEGTIRLLQSDKTGPYNIGSDQLISINDFVDLIAEVAGKTINKCHIDGPLGVRGRTSDNNQIKSDLDWYPSQNLKSGIAVTYEWILNNIKSGIVDH